VDRRDSIHHRKIGSRERGFQVATTHFQRRINDESILNVDRLNDRRFNDKEKVINDLNQSIDREDSIIHSVQIPSRAHRK
jgi:hypothetical protein